MEVAQGSVEKKPRLKNDLSGSQWLSFTKTWFIHGTKSKGTKEIHPAPFPDDLAEKYIGFFTKPHDWVIDPFAGTGSTLVAANHLNRNCVGIELYKEYFDYANSRIIKTKKDLIADVYQGDCRTITKRLEKKYQNIFDLCLTSPPYWCQLEFGKNKRALPRKNNGLNTIYGNDNRDLGKIGDYNHFLKEQKKVFKKIDKLMKPLSYIVIVTNNIYYDGKLYPLAFDTMSDLSDIWIPKDEQIWCQNDKKLFPFGIFHSYVGNRSHHYCLIFRKE